jgi:hypothetical protein
VILPADIYTSLQSAILRKTAEIVAFHKPQTETSILFADR